MPNILKLGFDKYQKKIIKAYYVLMAVVLLVSVYKDINNALPMPSDMRNRIVGARMMKHGLSPYFDAHQTDDSIGYYEMFTPPKYVVTTVTATPFFHFILIPIADLPQFQINILWIFSEYLALFGCCLLSILSVPINYRNKIVPFAIGMATLFTYTLGWRIHVYGGQNYIFIPLLTMGCLYCIVKERNLYSIVLFALLSSSLILIRPIAILFFLPLVFFPKKYFKWGVGTLMGIAAYLVFVINNPVQKANWTDYFKALEVNVILHQQIVKNLPYKINSHVPLTHYEGVDIYSGVDQQKQNRFIEMVECSNLYIIYNKVFNKKLSITAMTSFGLALVIAILLPLVWFIKNNVLVSVSQLFILGFIVYEVYSFCTPIARNNYCWVEFLLPLLLMVTQPNKIPIWPTVLMLVGFYLNIATPLWLPVRQNIGEFLIVMALVTNVYIPLVKAYFLIITNRSFIG